MNKIYKFSAWWMACLVLLSSLTFTACDTNDVDTNQYKGGISLNVFGPSPVLRGGELRFLGCGMDQVASVLIPGCDAITDIQLISAEEIRVIVPQTALPGYVTLMLRNGESIVTKTQLTYSEPVSIESFSPESVRPGDVLTIKGEYLNLMHQVIFAENVIVSDEVIAEEEATEATSKFLKHTRNEIQVRVPEEAQSGKIILSDGAEIPNRLYSEVELQVVLPSVAELADYNNIKPGAIMTVTGENFDLVKEVRMENGEKVEFEFSAENKTLQFTLPANAVSGFIYVVPASGVRIPVASIELAKPGNFSCATSDVAAGGQITIQGENLDLVSAVIFSGEVEGEIISQSPEQLVVSVPALAQSGIVTFKMTNGEQVSALNLTINQPCHIVSSLEDDFEAGKEMIVEVANGELLTEVKINGVTVTHTLEGTQLKIKVPETAGANSILELVSSDVSVKYTVSFAKVIWTGSFVTTSAWEGNQDLGWGNYDWSSVQPGTIITVYYTLDMEETNWQIKLGGCAIGWNPLPTIPSQSLEAGSTRFSATLTAEDLLVLSQDNNAGLVVSGCNFTMTKITLK
ncbi:IPT/TIG domain-containing protein [Phocaeicola plebeius]|uniref:IPT/TIG domain-containing protein n=1 Tax=Phocaeicola plebeius TaxID=310297 RepID=UPI0026EDE16D|nr:IPT/TIG domain-containing protein [Phocaeicola plebeius]